ncbi:MAG: protein kinase [Candidatus Saganbacteria bacterium]|nr:protein kinase [Candidatus Saganbacteria bacterium]
MKFNILTPSLPVKMARNTGLDVRLKVIGRVRDGRQVAVDAWARFQNTSNALFPGWLVPESAMETQLLRRDLDRVVVKFSTDPELDQQLQGEKVFLESLDGHPGFPSVAYSGQALAEHSTYEYYTITRESPFLVMPFYEGKSLESFELKDWREGRLPRREEVAQLGVGIMPQMAEHLADLHDKGIVHRDVKPNNALFNEKTGALILLDFGRANWLTAEARQDTGTFGFYPPELQASGLTREDVRTDIYGYGATCFTLLTGEMGINFGLKLDPFKLTRVEYLFIGQNKVFADYYRALRGFSNKSAEELLQRLNMPAALKETTLGRYIVSLFHPAFDRRPANMRQVAEIMRQAGGELLVHELNLPAA